MNDRRCTDDVTRAPRGLSTPQPGQSIAVNGRSPNGRSPNGRGPNGRGPNGPVHHPFPREDLLFVFRHQPQNLSVIRYLVLRVCRAFIFNPTLPDHRNAHRFVFVPLPGQFRLSYSARSRVKAAWQ